MKNKKLKIFLNVLFGFITFFIVAMYVIIGIGTSKTRYNRTFANSTTTQRSVKGEVKWVTDDPLYPNEPYLCKADNEGNLLDDFKIACCTDLHLTETLDNDFTLTILSRMLDKVQPDLLVFVGDNVVDTTGIAPQKALNKVFEDKGIYWTFVLGNHDHEPWCDKGYSYEKARKTAFDTCRGFELDGTGSQSPHCLAQTNGNPSSIGYGTNYINIRGKDKKIIQSLFFFDCNKIANQSTVINTWYEDSINHIKSINNNVVPKSVAFNHIPFTEMVYAYDNIGKDSKVVHNYGSNEETMCPNNASNGLIEEFNKMGSTTGILFGHDHLNNLSVTYDNIRMTYSAGLQYNGCTRRDAGLWLINNFTHAFTSKYDDYIEGFTCLYVNPDSSLTYGCNYVQTENVLSGLERQVAKRSWGFITHPSKALNGITITSFIIMTGGVGFWWGYLIYEKVMSKKQNNKDKNKK